jgi:hypothetical protein
MPENETSFVSRPHHAMPAAANAGSVVRNLAHRPQLPRPSDSKTRIARAQRRLPWSSPNGRLAGCVGRRAAAPITPEQRSDRKTRDDCNAAEGAVTIPRGIS